MHIKNLLTWRFKEIKPAQFMFYIHRVLQAQKKCRELNTRELDEEINTTFMCVWLK